MASAVAVVRIEWKSLLLMLLILSSADSDSVRFGCKHFLNQRMETVIL